MATELRKLGATVEEGANYIRVTPPSPPAGFAPLATLSPQVGEGSILRHAAIDTYDDHRMAMCFSLAAFGGAGVRINDPKCVAKTFPDYFSELAKVTQAVPVIAIDGPSASGKGTVAQRVAQHLGYHYLDSGALYRLLALAAQQHNVALDDEAALAGLAARMDIRFEGADTWLDGAKVGEELRGEECASTASKVAALPAGTGSVAGQAACFPPCAGAGGGRARYGFCGVPGCGAQGVFDRQCRGACRSPI